MKKLVYTVATLISISCCSHLNRENSSNEAATSEVTDTSDFIDPFDIEGDYSMLDSVYHCLDSMTKVIYGPDATLEDVKNGKYERDTFYDTPCKKALMVLREDTPDYKKLR